MMSEEAKEAYCKYMREYQRTDECKKKQKEWRKMNKDKINAYKREWAKRNPDKVRRYKETYWERRAAKELENENT